MLYPDFQELIALKKCPSKRIPVNSRPATSSAPGNRASFFKGQGLEFDAVREYVPGDDIRNIDWRVTARTGSAHLKVFKEEREHELNLCVDMNAAMRFGTKNTFKSIQIARAAALLGWQSLSRNDALNVCLFGDVPKGMHIFPPKLTRSAFSSVLKMLSEPHLENHETSIENAIDYLSKTSRSGCLTYIISDFLAIDENFSSLPALSLLANKGNIIFISINDIADSVLAPVGIIGCCLNASDKIFINTNSLEGRQAYKTIWTNNRNHLYATSAKFKIPVIELSTESDIRRDLQLELKSLTQRTKR